jgi:tRNA(Ile)-lysidine synthase
MRGTGLRGLAGIRPVRRFTEGCRLVRPLLCVTREEIIAYLRQRKVTWCEDVTNTDLRYTRNRIRHYHLPRLEKSGRICLTDSLSELAHTTYRLYNRLESEIQSHWSILVKSIDHGFVLNIESLREQPGWVQCEILRQVIGRMETTRLDMAYTHYHTMITMIKRGLPRAVDLSGGIRVSVTHHGLLINPRDRYAQVSQTMKESTLLIPGTTPYGSCHIEAQWYPYTPDAFDAFLKEKNQYTEWLDADKLHPPLQVRPRRPGDRFCPLGHPGITRVSKFLTNSKMPRSQRDRVLIVSDQRDIVWVCPVRISEGVKVTLQTRRVLALKVKTD